ncbi:MAG TPA: AI-2E family transporter [Kofleriaceae bacterium]|nr:AI-2E family transporter [Kofleriaceae bacterium]
MSEERHRAAAGLPPATPFDPATTTGSLEPIDPEIDPTAPGGGAGGRWRSRSAWGPGGWGRRMAKLWGFLGFCIFVLILARHVVLPFVFALLVAYIFAPLVNRMSRAPDGRRRMPRGLAIILCYIVLLTAVGLFMVALLPRVYKDLGRLGREAPSMYQRINDQYVPELASWLENRFPSLRAEERAREQAPTVADVPLPPGTQFVVTPLPDGRMAVQLQPTGVEVVPRRGGGFMLSPREDKPEPVRLEDRLRNIAAGALGGLQSELGDVFRLGQVIITRVIKSVYTFFLVLMIAAFLLLDLAKIHGFARGLIPAAYRHDYDVVVAGIDRGLSGVIRGQLIICLVNGVLTYVGLRVFGIKYALILSIVAALLSLIPIFGSILSTVPIVLAALVSADAGVDVARAVFITLWIIGIHFLEANFLNPKIIGTAAKIHPVLVIFALVLGEHSYGLVGALLAVPVASIVQAFFLYFRKKAWRGEPSGPVAASV